MASHPNTRTPTILAKLTSLEHGQRQETDARWLPIHDGDLKAVLLQNVLITDGRQLLARRQVEWFGSVRVVGVWACWVWACACDGYEETFTCAMWDS